MIKGREAFDLGLKEIFIFQQVVSGPSWRPAQGSQKAFLKKIMQRNTIVKIISNLQCRKLQRGPLYLAKTLSLLKIEGRDFGFVA